LEGIKVVEVAMWMFAPACAAILADLGADVVKVEHPEGGGDPQRHISNRLMLAGGPAAFTEIANHGKRSLGMNIGHDLARPVLERLVAEADVFITNFLPPARRKLRIDESDIRAINPRIIYARASGMGPTGPEADDGGYDLAAGWGRGGTAYKLTPEGGEPPMMPASFYDLTGAMALAGGIGMALLRRERTGDAGCVDASLLNTGMWPLGPDMVMAPWMDLKVRGGDRREPGNPTVNWYPTKDDRWVYLVHLQSDRWWPELCERIGRADLIADPRFSSHDLRVQNQRECVAILDDVFRTRTLEEWKQALRGSDGVWAPIQKPAELHDDPMVNANGYLPDCTSQDGTKFRMVSPPFQFDGQPYTFDRPAPEAGQNTEEILLELGIEWDDIAAGKEAGAFQ
jgi:formyl-CoA transferase